MINLDDHSFSLDVEYIDANEAEARTYCNVLTAIMQDASICGSYAITKTQAIELHDIISRWIENELKNTNV